MISNQLTRKLIQERKENKGIILQLIHAHT